MVYLSVLLCLLCVGCSTTNNLIRTSGYTTNTETFNSLREGKIKTNPPRYKSQQWDGEYNHYFGQIGEWSTYSYQLVYHHPKDFTPDTYSYYIALVRFPVSSVSMEEVSALYNGKLLPIAVQEQNNALFKDQYYVNILLTQEQLIEAYEGPGKLIIYLTVTGKKYDVVFPDYYLRKVLAQTTNISKYKEDELLANSPTLAANEEKENKQQPITYQATFPDPYPNTRESYGKEEKIAFNFKAKDLDVSVTYVYQYAKQKYEDKMSGYVKSVLVNGVADDYGTKIKVKFENNYELKIKDYTLQLFNTPKQAPFDFNKGTITRLTVR